MRQKGVRRRLTVIRGIGAQMLRPAPGGTRAVHHHGLQHRAGLGLRPPPALRTYSLSDARTDTAGTSGFTLAQNSSLTSHDCAFTMPLPANESSILIIYG